MAEIVALGSAQAQFMYSNQGIANSGANVKPSGPEVLVFTVSAWNKVIAPHQFRESLIDDFQIPMAWSHATALTIIGLEISCILLLFFTPLHGHIFGIALLLIFSVSIARVLRSGETIFCRCFGNSHEPLSWLDLVRNGFYLIVALYALVYTAETSSTPNIGNTIAIALLAIYLFILSVNLKLLKNLLLRA